MDLMDLNRVNVFALPETADLNDVSAKVLSIRAKAQAEEIEQREREREEREKEERGRAASIQRVAEQSRLRAIYLLHEYDGIWREIYDEHQAKEAAERERNAISEIDYKREIAERAERKDEPAYGFRALLPEARTNTPPARKGDVAPALAPSEYTHQVVGLTKDLRLKASGGTGTFTGYLSTFNNVDLGNDTIVQGAYQETLQAAQARRAKTGSPYLWPVLWQHDTTSPVGGVSSAVEDSTGLLITGEIDLDTDIGRQCWNALSKGYAQGLSIGYSVPTGGSKYQGNTRVLSRISLFEASVVTLPMDPNAGVTSVGAAKQQFSDFLRGEKKTPVIHH